MSEKPFTTELREQAKIEPGVVLQLYLREQADLIDEALSELGMNQTRSAMVRINSMWAHGERLLMRSQEGAEPDILSS